MNTDNTSKASAEKQGSIDCPKCGSDRWRSAKLVVLDGTTMTEGSIEGSVRDIGRFGGGVRSFLLSDRWFSRDYPIEADLELSSITALADSIKSLMVSEGQKIPTPTPPKPIEKIRFWDRVVPIAPKEPTGPVMPDAPREPRIRPWYVHMVTNIVVTIIFMALIIFGMVLIRTVRGLPAMTDTWLGVVAVTTLGFFAWDVISSFSRNRWEEKEYMKRMKKFSQASERAREKHREAVARYREKLAEYEASLKKLKAQDAFEASEKARYERETREYEGAMRRVESERERLWEQSRVCSRCGATYLGGAEAPS